MVVEITIGMLLGGIGTVISTLLLGLWLLAKFISKYILKDINLKIEDINNNNEQYKIEQNALIEKNDNKLRVSIKDIYNKINQHPENITEKLKDYVLKESYRDDKENLLSKMDNILNVIEKLESRLDRVYDDFSKNTNLLSRVEEKVNSIITPSNQLMERVLAKLNEK